MSDTPAAAAWSAAPPSPSATLSPSMTLQSPKHSACLGLSGSADAALASASATHDVPVGYERATRNARNAILHEPTSAARTRAPASTWQIEACRLSLTLARGLLYHDRAAQTAREVGHRAKGARAEQPQQVARRTRKGSGGDIGWIAARRGDYRPRPGCRCPARSGSSRGASPAPRPATVAGRRRSHATRSPRSACSAASAPTRSTDGPQRPRLRLAHRPGPDTYGRRA